MTTRTAVGKLAGAMSFVMLLATVLYAAAFVVGDSQNALTIAIVCAALCGVLAGLRQSVGGSHA